MTAVVLDPARIRADLSGEGLVAAATRAAALLPGEATEIVTAATVLAVLSHLQHYARSDGSDVVTRSQLADLGRQAAQLLSDHHAHPGELIALGDDGLPLPHPAEAGR